MPTVIVPLSSAIMKDDSAAASLSPLRHHAVFIEEIPPPPPPPPPPHPCRQPWASLVLVLSISFFFFYGVQQKGWVLSTGWNDFSQVYPAWPQFYAMSVGSYGNGCADLRGQAYRLVLYQLLHAGLWHWGFNMMSLAVYGVLLEGMLQSRAHPLRTSALVLVVFQVAVVIGALGNAYNMPYSELVGCSAGVYGLIGLCWAVLLGSRWGCDTKKTTLLVILSSQLLSDILSYTVFWSRSYGYIAHFCGGLAGFSLGLLLLPRHGWLVRLVGLGLFVFCAIFLTLEYLNFPPQFPISPFFGGEPYIRSACCLDAFNMMASENSSIADIKGAYYCAANHHLKRRT